MQNTFYLTVLALIFSFGCTGKASSELLVGEWAAKDTKGSITTKLLVEANGNFTIEKIAAKAVCDSKSDRLIGGKGTWEYDDKFRRVLLNFTEYIDPLCKAPFLGNAFLESSIFSDRILIYPDGADQPASAVGLSRR